MVRFFLLLRYGATHWPDNIFVNRVPYVECESNELPPSLIPSFLIYCLFAINPRKIGTIKKSIKHSAAGEAIAMEAVWTIVHAASFIEIDDSDVA
jgi:hypothetical protein